MARPIGPAGLPLAPLYTGAGGHPKTHKLILEIVPQPCAVPPSTIFHLGHIVAVLRRSPASVVHQDRHHAVVLTELIPGGFAGSRPGDVIELYVYQELGGAGVMALGSVGSGGGRTTTSSTLCQRFRCDLQGYVDQTLPLVAMHHHDPACA